MKDMESAVQYSVANVDIEPNKMIMYVGMNHAPGGYVWVFPKGNRFANIGIGISGKYSKHKSNLLCLRISWPPTVTKSL
jgi:digeranylgeranylglycerophospholipid reductase